MRIEASADNVAAAKPAGAYRPPGARGTLASDAYKRDENGYSSPSASGTSTPTPGFRGGKPAGRYIPGQPPGAAPPAQAEKGDKKKKVRSKRPMKEGGVGEDGGEVVGLEKEVEELQVGEDKGSVDEAVQKKIRGLNKKVSRFIKKGGGK